MRIRTRTTVNLKGVRTRIAGVVKEEMESIAQEILDGLIEMSPVFSGNYRASWLVTEGAPRYFAASGGSGVAPLPPPVIRVKASADFPVLYITNGQPYAARLEYGWSGRAPAGVLRVVVADVKARRR